MVDGLNRPLSGGNFIDLCVRGFYDGTTITKDVFTYGLLDEKKGTPSTLDRTIFGLSGTGKVSDGVSNGADLQVLLHRYIFLSFLLSRNAVNFR